MIELNKNIEIGLLVTVPASLSWQVAEAKVAGDYFVASIIDDDHILLSRISDSNKLVIDMCALSYLSGTRVMNPQDWTEINSSLYQPDLSDDFRYDYFTEDNEEFGFWYCGWFQKYRCIIVQLLTGKWCYGKLPWNC